MKNITEKLVKTLLSKPYDAITHLLGRVSKRHYFEDFVRVHPNGTARNRFGIEKKSTNTKLNKFLNHCKFYNFAAQFVSGKAVGDIGCGSGYGCTILRQS